MFQTNVVHSLLRGLDPLHQKSINLNSGQIFNGKILKLYPGQLASLQLGGLTLTAKLEAALTAGNRYWFQVQPSEGLPELKVIEGSKHIVRDRDNESILRQLGISNTKASESLIRYLASNDIPFTRDHIIQGADVLQRLGLQKDEGLSILKMLIERNLPITPASFSALSSVVKGEGLSHNLVDLSNLLGNLQMKEPVIHQLQQFINGMVERMNVQVDQNATISLIKDLLGANQASSTFQEAQLGLQQLGLKPKTPDQLLQHVREALSKAPDDLLKQLWPTLSKDQINQALTRGQISEIFTKVVIENSPRGEKSVQQLLSLLAINQNKEENSNVSQQLASIISRIGYQYERDTLQLLQRTDGNESQLLQLKSLLLKAQQLQLPSSIQEKIELLTNRITGQQLLSVNPEGVISHYAVLVPLKLFGKTTDLTVQWEGKKDQSGKLNPDHCRILFYLNLDNLKETVIDVQIQTRIVSVHVINEREKPTGLINALLPYLKTALSELDYQLSAVKWTQPMMPNPNTGFQSTNAYNHQSRQYQGVDIRI